MEKDIFKIGKKELKSRLFVGTGKYGNNKELPQVLKSAATEVVTMAVRRVDLDNKEEDVLSYIPKDIILLPNTSGARNAEEAVRIAELAKAMGCGTWVKIEVIADSKYLVPDNLETLKATEALVKKGFTVLPYMSPDLMMAKRMADAGAAAVMPLAAPIGSNRGLKSKELIQIMIDEINNIPIVVDAGIGAPSDAAEAMEMGADAVLVNTAIASSNNPIVMAEAFRKATEAGRLAYLAGLGLKRDTASASSPLTGFLGEEER